MLVNIIKDCPDYLREGRILSGLPITSLNAPDLAKVYAYQLCSCKSTHSPKVNLILDELKRMDDKLHPEWFNESACTFTQLEDDEEYEYYDDEGEDCS